MPRASRSNRVFAKRGSRTARPQCTKEAIIAATSEDGGPAWHLSTPEACLARLNASRSGLSQAEAEARIRRHGRNELPGRRRAGLFVLFLRQFRSPLIYLLLAAAATSLALGHRVDAAFIFAVLLINATIGTVQERRADRGMAALERLIRHSARVRRDGALRTVDAAELVPGDVVELESGMAVPADLRLLEAHALQADESLLSGESLPAAKDAEAAVAEDSGLGDRPTILHAGTTIVEGRAVGLVVATGLATALGEIQASLGDAAGAAPPPLVLRLARLTRQIAVGAIALILLLAALLALEGQPGGEILLLAVALAVSAIPEGLPIAVTVALATATGRMARRNVIVRALPAVEGLGACTLIASDKTGTLTMNRLSVERILLADGRLLDRGNWRHGAGVSLARLARASALCNEARISDDGETVGDTVDAAMLIFAREAGAACDADIVARVPYEPARRYAAVAIRAGAEVELFVKGAPEVVASMCTAIDPARHEKAEALAAEGYRLIAVAAGRFPADEVPSPEAPCGLELIGWVALLDPLRPEAIEAVASCKAAGIDVRMITGDHPATARTIAAQLGLCADGDSVVTGAQIAAAVDRPERLAALIRDAKVFARIEPMQKTVIVEALTAAGHLVAVTGDGVNDAPALQAAHIGVAMGEGGTDVAREAADLVLTDDNFASIVSGVEEGRIVYANLRKIVIFLIATGVAEIFMFLGALAAGLPMPLTAVQLIWSNLVTNGAQDVMLGFGRGEGDELRQRPRRPDEPILDRKALLLLVPPAFMMSVLALVMMDWALARGAGVADAQNAVLLLTVLFQNAYVLSMRSERRPIWREPLASNPWLLLGVAAALGLHLVAMHWSPLRSVLGTAPVETGILLICLAGAGLTVIVAEGAKWAARRR